jgi:hypothetical protein
MKNKSRFIKAAKESIKAQKKKHGKGYKEEMRRRGLMTRRNRYGEFPVDKSMRIP